MEAFDIYTMATQASKKEIYHAAVAFHEQLVKHFGGDEKIKEIRYSYFKNDIITYDRAKYLLKVAVMTHDNALLNKGQYGKYHTCNSRPFSSKFEEKHYSNIDQNITAILDRDTLFSYKPLDREERALSGRQRWTAPFDTKEDTKLFSAYIAAQNSQISTLCAGKQIRVNSNSEVLDVLNTYLVRYSFCNK